jgi:hypothetical protein
MNTTASGSIQLEEFKLLKEELAAREKAMGSLTTFATVSSVSLLSALIAVGMRDVPTSSREWPFAFVLLSPLFILLPTTWLLLSHRREIHKIGSYLQAFYDERAFGTRWEVRVEAFRQHFERSETLDAVPALIWAVSALCAVAFGYVCYRLQGPLYVLSFLFIPAMALLWFHADWRAAATKDREAYLRIWQRIRDAEA